MDAEGRPHIVFYSDDPDGVPQYQHLWFDGREWSHSFISRRTEPFVLAGGGTLRIPISRPEIIIDDECHVYVIYRGDTTDSRMVAQRLLPPHYRPDPDALAFACAEAGRRLGSDRFDDALDVGRAMQPDQAAALALGERAAGG